ncbi:MAG: response regulator [Gammaproteobacteria bacterium]|nr:response regulator [Gammaproteobacteria bacterium]
MTNKDLKNILYAEDESDIREIAQIALEDIGGFIVTYCSNGREAVEKAKDIQPDLILLDVMMPEMDGPTTLKALRKIPYYSSLPVIFMTAKIQPDEIAKYKEMGALDVISKPFDPMTLADSIMKIWERYLETCQ